MKKTSEILLATSNKGKISEFADLMSNLHFRLRNLSEFPDVAEVAETGSTFAENAVLKAAGYAKQTGVPTLADDSGLEVTALGDAPGIFSARFGGTNLSDAQRIEKLLFELEKTKDKKRQARFVCAIAVADKNTKVYCSAIGICLGRIAPKALGSNGFGYDSVFVPDGFEKTFGEIPLEIKQKISHRARALNEVMRFLQDFLQI